MKKKKLLIVEDDFINSMLLEEYLKNYDFEVFSCSDGISAVEIYTQNLDIQVILMDLRLPRLSGIEASKQIKEINSKVFIIAQSAYDSKETKLEVAIAGIDVFLSKPINMDELDMIIKALAEK